MQRGEGLAKAVGFLTIAASLPVFWAANHVLAVVPGLVLLAGLCEHEFLAVIGVVVAITILEILDLLVGIVDLAIDVVSITWKAAAESWAGLNMLYREGLGSGCEGQIRIWGWTLIVAAIGAFAWTTPIVGERAMLAKGIVFIAFLALYWVASRRRSELPRDIAFLWLVVVWVVFHAIGSVLKAFAVLAVGGFIVLLFISCWDLLTCNPDKLKREMAFWSRLGEQLHLRPREIAK